jgi:hypothetical protein
MACEEALGCIATVTHPEDGPTRNRNLGQSWYLNGKRHQSAVLPLNTAMVESNGTRHDKERTRARFAALRKVDVLESKTIVAVKVGDMAGLLSTTG